MINKISHSGSSLDVKQTKTFGGLKSIAGCAYCSASVTKVLNFVLSVFPKKDKHVFLMISSTVKAQALTCLVYKHMQAFSDCF